MFIKQTPYGTMYRNDKGVTVWLANTINKQLSVWKHDEPATRRVFSAKVDAIEYVNYLVNGEV